ncbi:MAG TPA: biotin synthase BioB [Candidatus Anaerostipes avistercoris]|uniref:Biotin synthase n=1 Tax=Candidatus Anaerostipes avistercoris TaxID=2838462 RepID=A0A9D2PGA2_9FIRM|nr:biotin synthase BioB [uncultured Anaerostipes sp.]HJC49684.1 biotin synthase BioB [Candidatus Anaerostipes avistercoris]
MSIVRQLKEKVMSEEWIGKEEALQLAAAPLKELTEAADEIRRRYCGDTFDICTIINGKSGKCSEDCKFCAQSSRYHTGLKDTYPLLGTEELLEEAKYNADRGVLRYSIVTSGRCLSDREVERLCDSIRKIKEETDIRICVSPGLLQEEQFRKLKEAGADRVHCNLESSERYFLQVCTTHTYEEKTAAIQAAKRVGLSVCSGGILGLGESVEDRIDMVLTARKLGVRSIPVNVLNPIPGTPYEKNPVLSGEEILRCTAVFRFLIPDGLIRLAGGRGLMEDKGKKCFQSGANAAISGDMLTTAGITVESDMEMIRSLGYKVSL